MAAPAPDGALAVQLARFDQELRACEPQCSQAYDEMVARLLAAESGSWAPNVGDPFPLFLLPDERGRLVSLEDLIATGPVVVSFNRGHWCDYCRLELQALQAIKPDITGCGASIVSITPELPVHSAQYKSESAVTFPLLCDLDLGVSFWLGLAIPVGEQIATLLASDGIELSQLNGGAGWLLPIPATFVIGRDGRIAARHVDPDFRRRLEPAQILAALRQL
jgi:peroxiredoxin